MEVPGQKETSGAAKGEKADGRVHCGPCGKKNSKIQAAGYCQDCREYLCDTCFNVHTIPTPLEHHVLLDRAHMPKPSSDASADNQIIKCTIRCPDHSHKVVDVFCYTHNTAICGKCAFRDHKTCDAKDVQDAARTLTNPNELSDLSAITDELKQDIAECSSTTRANTTISNESCDHVVQEMTSVKEKLIAHFEKKEKDFIAKSINIKDENSKQEQKQLNDLQHLKEKAEIVEDSFGKHSKELGDIFIVSNRAQAELTEIQTKLNEVSRRNVVRRFSFKCESAIEDLLLGEMAVGHFTETQTTTSEDTTEKVHKIMKGKNERDEMPDETRRKIHSASTDLTNAKVARLQDINVKLPSDKNDPFITGCCVLTQTTILVADRENASVKMIDTNTGTVISSLQFSSDVWDVACLTLDEAAVTIPAEKHIQLISTKPTLIIKRKIAVKDQCFGISSTNDKLVVSYRCAKEVQVMDLSGNVLQTISNADFGMVDYMAVGSEANEETIFVSDVQYDKHSITKWSMSGQLLATFNDIGNQYGLTITSGTQLLVADFINNAVHLVHHTDGTWLRTLLTEAEGIQKPRTVCYSAAQNRVFVGCYEPALRNMLKVYQLE